MNKNQIPKALSQFAEKHEISKFTAVKILNETLSIDFYRGKITKRHLGKVVSVNEVEKDFLEIHKNEILYRLTYSH